MDSQEVEHGYSIELLTEDPQLASIYVSQNKISPRTNDGYFSLNKEINIRKSVRGANSPPKKISYLSAWLNCSIYVVQETDQKHS